MDFSTLNRPQLREKLISLGLKPPFPRSNRDCIALIEVTLRQKDRKDERQTDPPLEKTVKSPIVKKTTVKKKLDVSKKKTKKEIKKLVKKTPPPPVDTSKTPKTRLPLVKKNSGNTDTPNLDLIIKELEVLQRDYATKVSTLEDPEANKKEKKSFTFKSFNLRTAIRHLKDRFKDHDITEASQATGIPRLGKETLSKITEILDRGHLDRADQIRQDPRLLLKESLMGVYGIGSVKANQLIDEEGITSLEHLRTRRDLLNDVQLVGLEYYDDINRRIPIYEMKEHDRFLQTTIKEVDPKAILTIAGSYRRGKKDSGDIDVLVTHPDNPPDLLARVIQTLHQKNYLIATLVSGDHKFHGLSQLSNKRHCRDEHNKPDDCRPRRIDFLYCSPSEYPFALLHFTGSGSFNQMIRFHAQKQGFSLSEHGIKRHDGKMISNSFQDEKEIFDFLGVEWIHPTDREHIPKLS